MEQLIELNTISERVEKIKQEIQLLILNLPDNPNINRSCSNPKAFTINSSQIFSNLKVNPHSRMDVFFHCFKSQYKYISGVIEKAHPKNVVGLLQRIILEGRYQDKSFNPVVIEHLRSLIEK